MVAWPGLLHLLLARRGGGGGKEENVLETESWTEGEGEDFHRRAKYTPTSSQLSLAAHRK